MKVLSLTEPYATLIKEKKKKIETRSWKTSYRGTLYIHASLTKMSKETKENKELMELVDDKALNYGNIICKCNLVDCLYMTKEYVEKIKKDNYQEYICGEYKEGRYAWILDDIVIITPIKAKGQLSIWNYYNELEIRDLMEDIEYGWVDKKQNKYKIFANNFSQEYRLQSPKEVIKNKIGLCWDQVELERYYFKGNAWNIKTYFMVYYDGNKCPTHTFLTYEKNGKYYWFEHAWQIFAGIYEYDTIENLLLDVKNKFIKYELNNKCIRKNLLLYEYKKPKYHLTVADFYKHCELGTLTIFSS